MKGRFKRSGKHLLRWTAGAAAVLATGCVSLKPCPAPGTVAELPPREIDSVLFLIGDAGEPVPSGDPVLMALRSELEVAVREHGSERVVAAFLGDNIYPAGLPAPGSSKFEKAQAKLDAQIDVFAPFPDDPPRPLGVFVPGNHDWAHSVGDGLERILRQEARLAERGRGRVVLRPGRGCPGPAVDDIGDRLRLVSLDTHWWFRKAVKPEGPSSGCEAGSMDETVALVEERLAGAGSRHAVVIGHHPFRSGGPHGGATLLLRRLGLIPQDLSSRPYKRMIAALEGAFKAHPPLVYAAGHEHSLQLLDDGELPYLAISGSGSFDHLTGVGTVGEDSLFCRRASGFMRLDLARDGRVRLAAIVVDAESRGTEAFSTFLRTSDGGT